MRCFVDGKPCACKLDGHDCQRDPFRGENIRDEHEEEYSTIERFARSMGDEDAAHILYG